MVRLVGHPYLPVLRSSRQPGVGCQQKVAERCPAYFSHLEGRGIETGRDVAHHEEQRDHRHSDRDTGQSMGERERCQGPEELPIAGVPSQQAPRRHLSSFQPDDEDEVGEAENGKAQQRNRQVGAETAGRDEATRATPRRLATLATVM